METERLRAVIAGIAGPVMRYSADDLRDFKNVMTNPDIRDYLTACLPAHSYVASGVRVKNLDELCAENAPETAPGGYIFPHGFLVLATSVGGNAVCVSAMTSQVLWADHSSFARNRISWKDRSTGRWVNCAFDALRIPEAMTLLAPTLEPFLDDLLCGRATMRLAALD